MSNRQPLMGSVPFNTAFSRRKNIKGIVGIELWGIHKAVIAIKYKSMDNVDRIRYLFIACTDKEFPVWQTQQDRDVHADSFIFFRWQKGENYIKSIFFMYSSVYNNENTTNLITCQGLSEDLRMQIMSIYSRGASPFVLKLTSCLLNPPRMLTSGKAQSNCHRLAIASFTSLERQQKRQHSTYAK